MWYYTSARNHNAHNYLCTNSLSLFCFVSPALLIYSLHSFLFWHFPFIRQSSPSLPIFCIPLFMLLFHFFCFFPHPSFWPKVCGHPNRHLCAALTASSLLVSVFLPDVVAAARIFSHLDTINMRSNADVESGSQLVLRFFLEVLDVELRALCRPVLSHQTLCAQSHYRIQNVAPTLIRCGGLLFIVAATLMVQ